MTYKCEENLREKAQTFIQTLLKAGIPVEPYPTMFRDYMVKLAVNGAGYISIYYSPKQQSFSLKLHELRDTRLVPQIEACWQGDGINSDGSLPNESYQAYVDGSYINGSVGYGAVILHQNQEIKRFSGLVEHDVEQRQVVGELQATMQVLVWCEENNIVDIEIFYDYEGIQKWAAGEWRANTTATQHYQQTVQASLVNVTWQKVKSHSGVRWNDVVDELAKQGAQAHSGDVAQPEDPVAALEQKASNFVKFLADQGIDAEYTQIYNEQYARIIIERGYFDLYNTKKRPMMPYLHNFIDKTFQKQIEDLWQQFFLNATQTKQSDNRLAEVEYYLGVFAPYRHLDFDYSVLCEALRKAIGNEYIIDLSKNYDELERIYQELRAVL